MRKTLLEVVVKHTGLFRHNRKGGVVTHRTQGVSEFFNHWLQHELHGFLGITKCLHARNQRIRI